uniref:Uncharacterized protein n=1 Tax=Lates calcarifer TaxID=8187 RepID=A0A4W6C3Z8_LATCA
MAPHGEELSEQVCNQIVRLHKNGRLYKTISMQNTFALSPKMTLHTYHYLCNLALKNRWISASDLAQGLSVETGFSVTDHKVRRTLQEVKLYGRRPRRKPLLTKWHETAKLNFPKNTRRSLMNVGSTFFGQTKPTRICLDQMGASMFGMDLTRTTTVTLDFKEEKVKPMTWPRVSPDLNSIEHLWCILKQRVKQQKPSSKEQLKRINLGLVSSMLKRIKSVIKIKGRHTT